MGKRRKMFVLLSMVIGLIMTSAFASILESKEKRVPIHMVFQTGGDAMPVFAKKAEIEKALGVKLTIEEIPAEGLYEKLMTEFITHTGVYDVIEFYPTWMGDFAEPRFLLNLDPYFEQYADEIDVEDYIEGAQVGFDTWKGSWYAVPYDGDVLLFMYRKDLLEDPKNKAGFKKRYGYELKPPNTWDEVLPIAEFFNGWDWDGDGKDNYGAALVAARLWWSVPHWAQAYNSYGGEFFDEEGNIVLDKKAFMEAYRIWTKLLECSPPGKLSFGFIEAKEAFASGQTAMCIQWATSLWVDPRQSKVHDKTGFAVMPGVRQPDGTIYRTPALAVGKCLAIPADSKHPDEAFKVAMYLSSKEMQIFSTLSGCGIEPNRYSVFEDPRVKKMWGDVLPVIRESLRIGCPDIKRRGSSKFYEVISAELSSLWAGRQSAETVYERIVSQWKNIIKEME